MIKLNENIIRWIIAVPCILLTVCLVLYRAYRHSASDRERLALSLEEFRDKEKKSVLIQRVSQQMEEIAYQQKDISERLLHNWRLRKRIGWQMNKRIWRWNGNYRPNGRRGLPIHWLFWLWDVHWGHSLLLNIGRATWN